MESRLEELEIYVPAITAPIVFSMNTVGDRMILSVSQSFEDDTIIRSFEQICRKNALAIHVKDMGIEEYDTLGAEAVEMI